MRIGLFLLQERSISCCAKRSRFFFTLHCLVQRVARRWRELDCSPADELCPCARTGSCICASKCESLLSAHLSVLLSAIQRKIMVTEGQEVHIGSITQLGELGLVWS